MVQQAPSTKLHQPESEAAENKKQLAREIKDAVTVVNERAAAGRLAGLKVRYDIGADTVQTPGVDGSPPRRERVPRIAVEVSEAVTY